MVAKQFDAQMIQEWKEEFMNYRQLKKLIKMMKLSMTSSSNQNDNNSNGNAIFSSVSSFVKKVTSSLSSTNNIIKLRKKPIEDNGEEIYETELVQLFPQDNVPGFFVRLDDELNKVNGFYIKKESEFLKRGDTLKKLLEILLDLKQIVNGEEQLIDNAEKVPPSTQDPNLLEFIVITNLLWEDLVNNPTGDFLHKKMIQSAQKILRNAFVEFYKNLDLLKNYSSLNMVAFSKILKKFNKVSGQKISICYLDAVERSGFVNSDKVMKLVDEMESIFSKHFANNDRKKAMKFLRPKQSKNSDMINFFVGLTTGCFVSLFYVYVFLAHFYSVFSPINESVYMKTMYPIFSVFALLSLHLFMYGCNLYMWKRTRINYNAIFDFSPRTSLKCKDAFWICAILMTIVVGAMVIHILLSVAGFSHSLLDAFPEILLLCFIALIFLPFDVFYRPTRYFFIRIIRNIICSPLCNVMLIDMFMADQLTSQITLLRHLEATNYNFFVKVFKIHPHETRHSRMLYMEIIYFISFFPYVWGSFQCIRRWFDSGDVNNLANMVKYVSALVVAAGARVAYSRQHDNIWFVVVLVTSIVTTVYHLYWDIVKDCDFLNSQFRNLWLRDDLILKNTKIYYMSMVLNIILRMAWVQSIMHFETGAAKVGLIEFLLAAAEVVQRGHWNFYRIEIEHIRKTARDQR